MEIFRLIFSKIVWIIILICLGIGLIILRKYVLNILKRRREKRSDERLIYAIEHGLYRETVGCFNDEAPEGYHLYKEAEICLFEKNKIQEGIDILINGIKINPNIEKMYKLIVYAYIKLKMYEQAIKYSTEGLTITESIKIEEEDNIQKCIFEQNKKDKIKYLKLSRGKAYMEMKDFNNAICDFTDIIKLYPPDYEHFYNCYIFRSKAYMEIGKFDLARLDLEKALKYCRKYNHSVKDTFDLLEILKQKENLNKT